MFSINCTSAAVIEKHFTLDKINWLGSFVSADLKRAKIIVNEGRKIFSMLGSYNRNISDHENNLKNMRKVL